MQMSLLEEALSILEQLPAKDKVRAIERLAGMLEREVIEPHDEPLNSLYGLWADFKIDVSEEDIAEMRRDMLKNFPREDTL
jgi:hypothetical protein